MSTLRTSREFTVKPEAVFAAIADPVRLARWWGPAGFTNTFHSFEFKPGGAWRFTMHGPDGKDYPNESTFLEIVPHSRVRIKHLDLPHFVLSITLAPSAAGTLLSWEQVFEDPAFAEKMRQFLAGANEQNLDRLAQEIGKGAHGK